MKNSTLIYIVLAAIGGLALYAWLQRSGQLTNVYGSYIVGPDGRLFTSRTAAQQAEVERIEKLYT